MLTARRFSEITLLRLHRPLLPGASGSFVLRDYRLLLLAPLQ